MRTSDIEAIPVSHFLDMAKKLRKCGSTTCNFAADFLEALVVDWRNEFRNVDTQYHEIVWHTMADLPEPGFEDRYYVTVRDVGNPDAYFVKENYGYYSFGDDTPRWWYPECGDDGEVGEEECSRFVAWAYMPTILPYRFCEDSL